MNSTNVIEIEGMIALIELGGRVTIDGVDVDGRDKDRRDRDETCTNEPPILSIYNCIRLKD